MLEPLYDGRARHPQRLGDGGMAGIGVLGGVCAYLVALRSAIYRTAFRFLHRYPDSLHLFLSLPSKIQMWFPLKAVVLIHMRCDLGAAAHVLVLPEPQIVGPVGGERAGNVVIRESVARLVAKLVEDGHQPVGILFELFERHVALHGVGHERQHGEVAPVHHGLVLDAGKPRLVGPAVGVVALLLLALHDAALVPFRPLRLGLGDRGAPALGLQDAVQLARYLLAADAAVVHQVVERHAPRLGGPLGRVHERQGLVLVRVLRVDAVPGMRKPW